MTDEKYSKANGLKSQINNMESNLNIIDFTYKQKYPPEFIIQGCTNRSRIVNAEINKKLELLAVELLKSEINKLKKEFGEL